MAVGVTACERKTSYFKATLDSIANSGLPKPSVRQDFDGRPFQNWCRLLAELQQSGKRLLIVQDDIVCCRHLGDFLAGLDIPGRVAVSLYTSSKDAHGKGLAPQLAAKPFGACAYLMASETAKVLLNHAGDWKSVKDIDQFVATCLRERGGSLWSFSPSLVQHVGEVSAIPGFSGGAHGRRAASDFVGEEFDAREYWRDMLPS